MATADTISLFPAMRQIPGLPHKSQGGHSEVERAIVSPHKCRGLGNAHSQHWNRIRHIRHQLEPLGNRRLGKVEMEKQHRIQATLILQCQRSAHRLPQLLAHTPD